MSDETIRSLQERHNKAVADAQALHASRTEDGAWTDEDQTQFDKYMGEAATLREKIDAREARLHALKSSKEYIDAEPEVDETRAERERSYGSIKDPEERDQIRNSGMNKLIRNWMSPFEPTIPRQELTALEREAVRRTRQNFPADHELRAAQQSIGTSSAGGVLVASEWQRSVLTQMAAYGGMRRVARILNTGTGGNYNIPTSDDTANSATIIAEATTGGTTHVPFALVTLEAAKYKSGPIKFSLELLQDSFIDIDAYVRERIAERFGRATEAHFATRSSTEATGPHGIVNYSTGAVAVAGGSTSLTFDHLIDLYHSVDPAYRTNAAWMLSDATLAIIAKLKDTTNQYLWRPGLAGPNPNSFLGKPFVVNQDIPSFVAAGTSTLPKFLWFGDWSHYVVRDVMPLSLFPMNERYLNEGNLAVIGFGRFDGRATFATTSPAKKPIRCAIQTT